MQIRIGDYQKIAIGKEPAVRFEVSIWNDEGRFLFSVNGWVINVYRTVSAPKSRKDFHAGAFSLGVVSKEFSDQLAAYLEKVPGVAKYLGPRRETYAEKRKKAAAERRIAAEQQVIAEGREGV